MTLRAVGDPDREEEMRAKMRAADDATLAGVANVQKGPGQSVIDWLDAVIGGIPLERAKRIAVLATKQNLESKARVDAALGKVKDAPGGRKMSLTAASTITVRPVRWMWDGRIPLGSLALLGGREGIGKTTLAYTLAADVTQGKLPGDFAGKPKSVIIAATEDSWEHTIVPRLMGAGADLTKVYRIDVTSADDIATSMSLPRDVHSLKDAITRTDTGLVLLDPLMSRLDGTLDSHRDTEVRQALEPIVDIADKSGAAVLGLIHVNKGGSSDPLTSLMGSRAFAAVARAVLFLMLDPDDDKVRLLGQPKNNLGRLDDLPTLTFTIDTATVAETTEGVVTTGRVVWGADSAKSIRDAIEASTDGPMVHTAVGEALDWLVDYLTDQGGAAPSKEIRAEGHKAGHTKDALDRARKRGRIASTSFGFPRQSQWSLPDALTVIATSGESPITTTTTTTQTTGQTGHGVQSSQSSQSPGGTREDATTEPEPCYHCQRSGSACALHSGGKTNS